MEKRNIMMDVSRVARTFLFPLSLSLFCFRNLLASRAVASHLFPLAPPPRSNERSSSTRRRTPRALSPLALACPAGNAGRLSTPSPSLTTACSAAVERVPPWLRAALSAVETNAAAAATAAGPFNTRFFSILFSCQNLAIANDRIDTSDASSSKFLRFERCEPPRSKESPDADAGSCFSNFIPAAARRIGITRTRNASLF